MINKLKQQLKTHDQSTHGKTATTRSRNFLINYVRQRRANTPSQGARATLGLTQRQKQEAFRPGRVDKAPRAICFITGRARGTSQRHTISRTKIKEFANSRQLIGTKKSSW
jgi:ribosomal protein S14